LKNRLKSLNHVFTDYAHISNANILLGKEDIIQNILRKGPFIYHTKMIECFIIWVWERGNEKRGFCSLIRSPVKS
jgi:hypothetical protein